LLDAVPPQWLVDGTEVRVEKAPTAFGEVTVRVASRLKQGEVVVEAEAPPRPVGTWTLRLPNPPGHTITGVRIGADQLRRDPDGRIDLTGRMGKFAVVFSTKPSK